MNTGKVYERNDTVLNFPTWDYYYSGTYLKRSLSTTEAYLSRKTFTVSRIWSPEDANFKYLHKTEHACDGGGEPQAVSL